MEGTVEELLVSAHGGLLTWRNQVVIVLEELQVPYEIKSFKFEEIKKKPFIDINPNGRVPGT